MTEPLATDDPDLALAFSTSALAGAVPWTAEEVDALVARQADRTQHPYTCADHTTAKLIPTEAGWLCPKVIDHATVQSWAHASDLGR